MQISLLFFAPLRLCAKKFFFRVTPGGEKKITRKVT